MSSHYEPTNTRVEENSLSFAILWSPLPPITWVVPFIGHMGIATSRGIACDFQGPYTIGERGRMVSETIVQEATSQTCIDTFSLQLCHILCVRHLEDQPELCKSTQVLYLVRDSNFKLIFFT